jgi:hypothetical protein
MQLIEVSVIGVRSAVVTLRRSDSPMRFVLYPMMHLGTETFYRQVSRRLSGCQLIVAEGVSGRSILTSALTMAYRLPGRRRRLGLVKQQIDLAGLGVPVIRPDLTAAEFKHGWRALPVLQRTMIICIAPVMAVGFFLFGTRRMLSRYANVDDLPDQMQSQVRDQAGEFEELIVDSRDRLLLSALDAIHDERCSESIAIAVVYGAGHMPAVVHHLLGRHGYRAREAEWLTVFPF